jgi:outer membrane protein assembly factor BamE (lipoprotein component of BamABCDE complex)
MFPITFAKAIAVAALAGAALLCGCAGASLGNGGPARSDEVFSHIYPGMTQDDVQRQIGRPDATMRFPLSNTVAWDYRYYDTWGYMAVFSVTFSPDGHALSRITTRINDGGDHGGK